MKSEPDVFGYDDLVRVKREGWDGVRNYQARNYMRSMAKGDQVIFYHSNAKPPGVAGIAKVVRTAEPDPTQFDPASKYHDPGAKPDSPRWICVEVEYVETLPRLVALEELRANPALAPMMLLRRGMRLSVQPVEAKHYKAIVAMARKPAKPAVKTAGKAPPPRPARRSPGRAAAKKPAR